MKEIQTQGVHHITLVGASRRPSIDFCDRLLVSRARPSLSDDRSPRNPY